MSFSGIPASITGVILAGGRGSRMGGTDKGLVLYRGKPLYQHVLQRLQPQVGAVYISANRNLMEYQQSGLPVITDSLPDFPGPLAGMLAALQTINSEWLLFTPCDVPELPEDLAAQLWQQKGEALAVWARTAERDHPATLLLHKSLVKSLTDFLQHGERKVMFFLKNSGGHSVLFNNAEAFMNINRPEDLSGGIQ